MNLLSPNFDDTGKLGILAIAQVGDAVYELMVRTHLCMSQPTAKKLHKARVALVNAQAQADAVKLIMPLLTPDEQDVFRRGRNTEVGTIPKSASRDVYMAATGLEAVWGYLYLTGRQERLLQLFEVIVYEKSTLSNH